MSLLAMLDLTMSLQAQTSGVDAIGGITVTPFVATLSGVKCARWPADSKTVYDFARRDITAEFMFVTAVDIHAAAGNRIVVGTTYYEVVGYMPFVAPFTGGSACYQTVTGRRNQT